MKSGRTDWLPAAVSIATTLPDPHVLLSKFSRARPRFAEALIVAIISSILARATVKPSSKWPRTRALLSSKIVRRVTTSWRWRTKAAINWRKVNSFGWPLSSATILILKLDSSGVCKNKLLTITSAVSPRRKSIAIRIPSLSDSSRISVIPSIFLSRTSSAIRSISLALLVW